MKAVYMASSLAALATMSGSASSSSRPPSMPTQMKPLVCLRRNSTSAGVTCAPHQKLSAGPIACSHMRRRHAASPRHPWLLCEQSNLVCPG